MGHRNRQQSNKLSVNCMKNDICMKAVNDEMTVEVKDYKRKTCCIDSIFLPSHVPSH